MNDKVKKATASIEGNTLTVSFAHGEELTVNVGDLPNDMKSACLMHGLKQKVCDSYSGVADAAECLEKAQAVVSALQEGNWSTRVAGEGGPRVTQLARALAMVTGRDLEEAVEVVGEMSDETKKQLGANPEIKKAVAEIKAEAARQAAEEAANATGPSILEILEGAQEEDAA